MGVYGFGLESKLTWVSKPIVVSAWNRPLHQEKDVGMAFREQEELYICRPCFLEYTYTTVPSKGAGQRETSQEFSRVH